MNGIGAAVGGLGACALAHATIRRLRPQGNSVLQFAALTGFGTVCLGITLHDHSATSLECAVSVSEFIFLSELYVFTFTLAISSISVATLLQLAGSASSGPKPTPIPGGRAPGSRFEGLVGAGLMEVAGPRFVVTPLGRAVLRIRHILRVFFGHASAARTLP